jgi:hypothetical protein
MRWRNSWKPNGKSPFLVSAQEIVGESVLVATAASALRDWFLCDKYEKHLEEI